MQDLPNGGGRTPSPKGASRVGLCARGGGVLIRGGGGRSKHWPPGAGDPRYATGSHRLACAKVKAYISRPKNRNLSQSKDPQFQSPKLHHSKTNNVYLRQKRSR